MSFLLNARPQPWTLGLGAAMLMAVLPSLAHAQVVYDGGDPNQTGGPISDVSGGFQVAETFTLDTLTRFDTVEWYGFYFTFSPVLPASDAFTIRFFGTTAGVPNATVLAGLTCTPGNDVNRTATGEGIDVGNYPEFAYSAALTSGVTLAAGTYAISIVNDTGPREWVWERTDPITSGQHFKLTAGTGAWTTGFGNVSFRLVNQGITSAAAPEPGTLTLLGLGIGTLGWVARRKR